MEAEPIPMISILRPLFVDGLGSLILAFSKYSVFGFKWHKLIEVVKIDILLSIKNKFSENGSLHKASDGSKRRFPLRDFLDLPIEAPAKIFSFSRPTIP